MEKFGHIFWFHFKESVLSRASLITGAIIFVAIIGIAGFSHLFSQGEEEDIQIVVVDEEGLLPVGLMNEMSETLIFDFIALSELDEAKESVESGEITQVLVVATDDVTGIPVMTSIFNADPQFEAVALVSHLLQQYHLEHVMAEEGISLEVAERLLTSIQILEEPLQNQEEAFQSFVISYAFNFVLYMIFIIFGQSIAMSVVSEKSSRVMEVMISKVKPIYMMFAKVLAVFATILTLVGVALVAALVASILGWFDFGQLSIFGLPLDLTIVTMDVLLAGLAFFILGYFLYGMMFATAGAMCSKVETLQSMSMPIIFLIMIPFFMAMGAPDASLVMQISTYIPFFAPFITFTRYVAGVASPLELGISMLLLVITIIVMARLATRIYVNGVMNYSEKVSWKDIRSFLKKS